MPQLQLPIFPQGLTSITEDLAFQQDRGRPATVSPPKGGSPVSTS